MEWTAIYNDGTRLHQFVENKENLFKDIDQDKLEAFTIHNTEYMIVVVLSKGTFEVNGLEFEIPKLSNKDEKYRLIYFRRNRVTLGTNGVQSASSSESFIGFQVTIDDKNYKVMISTNGEKFNIHVE